MAEWFKATVLKTVEVKASVSSNLTLSVSECKSVVDGCFWEAEDVGSNPITRTKYASLAIW